MIRRLSTPGFPGGHCGNCHLADVPVLMDNVGRIALSGAVLLAPEHAK